eukprot:COSAG02_NODE_1844_length_10683_cov_622.961357_2_plen_145_part_00
MGRAAAMEEKEQSLVDESMALEAKRSAKEIYMESVAEEREKERRHEVEARKLNYVARMKKVKRLQRQREYQSVLQKEDFEIKELKTNALLGACAAAIGVVCVHLLTGPHRNLTLAAVAVLLYFRDQKEIGRGAARRCCAFFRPV